MTNDSIRSVVVAPDLLNRYPHAGAVRVCHVWLPCSTLLAVALVLLALSLTSLHMQAAPPASLPAAELSTTPPTLTGTLTNASFECPNGYYSQTNSLSQTIHIPNDWSLISITGSPIISSARSFFAKSCDGSAHVERIHGIDSIYVRAQDLETPPAPGKPFDVAFYQQVTVMTDTAYSLSSWMLSLCGGSAVPSDCPAGQYIAKMIGIDPTGGTDPTSDTVIWSENRDNFVSPDSSQRIGWANVRTVAASQSATLTVFARVNSPFRWHGNHAFVDALSLVRAPTSEFADLPTSPIVTGTSNLPYVIVDDPRVELNWTGAQSPDVAAIEGGTYELLFDIQYRAAESAPWLNFVEGNAGAGCAAFYVPKVETIYEFRLRARAEQLSGGVFPNHRYPGVWSKPFRLMVVPGPAQPVQLPDDVAAYLPLIQRNAGVTVVPEACE